MHQLRSLRVEHNQLGLQLDMSGATRLAEILHGFADLRTLEMSSSLEVAELSKTLLSPVPPIPCSVGAPCAFTVTTRTADGTLMTRGGQRIVVQLVNLELELTTEASFQCVDSKDGKAIGAKAVLSELLTVGSASEALSGGFASSLRCLMPTEEGRKI